MITVAAIVFAITGAFVAYLPNARRPRLQPRSEVVVAAAKLCPGDWIAEVGWTLTIDVVHDCVFVVGTRQMIVYRVSEPVVVFREAHRRGAA